MTPTGVHAAYNTCRRKRVMQIINADGHVAENPSFAIEAMKRWPQLVTASADGRPRLVIEGRNYPEDTGPGAGCPPEHGISKASDINCRSVEGVLGDADRDHIDTMVLYPSMRLCPPSRGDPGSAPGFARHYNQWIADFCAPAGGRLRGVAVAPVEHGQAANEVKWDAKDFWTVDSTVP